ncbi:hypothetical protein V8E53_010321 [Lactarius tabidus]
MSKAELLEALALFSRASSCFFMVVSAGRPCAWLHESVLVLNWCEQGATVAIPNLIPDLTGITFCDSWMGSCYFRDFRHVSLSLSAYAW